jgi:hypothetical protein
LALELPQRYTPDEVAFAKEGDERKESRQRGWEIIGIWLITQNRLYDALAVFNVLYEHMLTYEQAASRRVHNWCNHLYVEHLRAQLGLSSGKALEHLARYLLSMIPGCRACRRQRTPSTDYDVVASFEGPGLDFRSEVGRYFVCECKDWKEPADFTTMAKLARVLDSVKSRFGILFSKNRISGLDRTEDAARERLKVFADRGIAIVVVSDDDIARVAAGENFLAMIRSKYESVRLDIGQPDKTPSAAKRPRRARSKKKPSK